MARKIQIYRFCVFWAFFYEKRDNIFLKTVILREKGKYGVLKIIEKFLTKE